MGGHFGSNLCGTRPLSDIISHAWSGPILVWPDSPVLQGSPQTPSADPPAPPGSAMITTDRGGPARGFLPVGRSRQENKAICDWTDPHLMEQAKFTDDRPKMLENTWKYLKHLKILENTCKFLKILKNTWKYLKMLENTWKYLTHWHTVTLDTLDTLDTLSQL